MKDHYSTPKQAIICFRFLEIPESRRHISGYFLKLGYPNWAIENISASFGSLIADHYRKFLIAGLTASPARRVHRNLPQPSRFIPVDQGTPDVKAQAKSIANQ
jgi:hypothetical protein